MHKENVGGGNSVAAMGTIFSADTVHQRLILNTRELSELALAEVTPGTLGDMERMLSQLNADLAELRSVSTIT